ncbi:hypothetical protein L6164_025933 [Bauhinia variegata]|uniref:Uncharacterized protein n=1 Tax=Bauhinia variegata TaxID=167791 RepID=A0ACB9M2F1_BAUVA|nr:hypothetical protein L6164_025933 [Bauhinia variegata]
MSYKGKLLAKGMQLEWVVQESEDDIYGQSAAPRLWVSEPADDQNLQTLLSDHLLSLSSLATFCRLWCSKPTFLDAKNSREKWSLG